MRTTRAWAGSQVSPRTSAAVLAAAACAGFAIVAVALAPRAGARTAVAAVGDDDEHRPAGQTAPAGGQHTGLRRVLEAIAPALEEARQEAARRPARAEGEHDRGPGRSCREVLAPVFGSDQTEAALLEIASSAGSSPARTQASTRLRERPEQTLAAIESVLARLPDPSLGTGPAHEILLRFAANELGLDATRRMDLLTRELEGQPDDTVDRPHRPLAALDLLIQTEPRQQVESLVQRALAKQQRPEVRDEMALRMAAAYPQ